MVFALGISCTRASRYEDACCQMDVCQLQAAVSCIKSKTKHGLANWLRLYICLTVALFGPGVVTLMNLPDDPTVPHPNSMSFLKALQGIKTQSKSKLSH